MTTAVEAFDRAFLWHFRALWLPEEYMDGDTLTVLTDNGHRGRHEPRIRLDGYSRAERYTPEGMDATRQLRDALTRGVGRWNLRVISKQRETVVTETTSFERYVSTVLIVMADGSLPNLLSLLGPGDAAS